jgi:hypothetical protein
MSAEHFVKETIFGANPIWGMTINSWGTKAFDTQVPTNDIRLFNNKAPSSTDIRSAQWLARYEPTESILGAGRSCSKNHGKRRANDFDEAE